MLSLPFSLLLINAAIEVTEKNQLGRGDRHISRAEGTAGAQTKGYLQWFASVPGRQPKVGGVRKEAAATDICFFSLKTMQVDGYWLKTQLFFPDSWSNSTHHICNTDLVLPWYPALPPLQNCFCSSGELRKAT